MGIAVDDRTLLRAVGAGDGATSRLLLDAGAPVSGRDASGRTPLMLALAQGDPGLAHRLIDSGSDLGAVDFDGLPVLAHAVRNGEVSVVKRLLDLGVDPRATVPGGGQLAVHAAADGRLASAKLMLEAGASPSAYDSHGTPLVFHAVRRGVDWMLHRLLKSGVPLTVTDAAGDTLLHAVVASGDRKTAEVILAHGARPDAKDARGRAALHLALANGDDRMIGLLIAHGARVDEPAPDGSAPIHLAVRAGDAGVLQALLQAGAGVDARDADSRSAFALALAGRDFDAAQLLVDYGAAMGDALSEAVAAGDAETVAFLLRNGADPNPSRDDPPLFAALRGGHDPIVAALLDAGAAVDQPGLEGQVPLHLAVARGEHAMVRELLAHGADTNRAFAGDPSDDFLAQVRSDGYIKWHLGNDTRVTPLMMAADMGDLEMARALLDHGADTSTYTRRHRYWPIGFAARRSDVRMMKLLLGRDPHRDERWIKVDLSAQRAWVHDEDGDTIYTTRISSGKKGHRTRTGEFVITNKTRHHVSNIYQGAKMPYFQRFSCGDFGFHEGYVPGYPASHGCLRVPAGAARKLWSLTRVGDKVVIVP